jgi:transposase-like protein
MGEHRQKADGRRVFSTEFKREAVQRILSGKKTVAGAQSRARLGAEQFTLSASR